MCVRVLFCLFVRVLGSVYEWFVCLLVCLCVCARVSALAYLRPIAFDMPLNVPASVGFSRSSGCWCKGADDWKRCSSKEAKSVSTESSHRSPNTSGPQAQLWALDIPDLFVTFFPSPFLLLLLLLQE